MDDPDTNKKFAESLGLDYPILSDPDKKIAKAFGVLTPLGFASRRTFYVGLDGRIQHVDSDVKTSSAGKDVAARLAALGVARVGK